MTEFCTRFRNLRIEYGHTQETLANALNKRYGTAFSKGTISKWESGSTSPAFSSIPMIANFFNVSADYLLGITDNEKDIYNPTHGAHDAALIMKYHSLSESDRKLIDGVVNRFYDTID